MASTWGKGLWFAFFYHLLLLNTFPHGGSRKTRRGKMKESEKEGRWREERREWSGSRKKGNNMKGWRRVRNHRNEETVKDYGRIQCGKD